MDALFCTRAVVQALAESDSHAEQQTAEPLADVSFMLSTHDGMRGCCTQAPISCYAASTHEWQQWIKIFRFMVGRCPYAY